MKFLKVILFFLPAMVYYVVVEIRNFLFDIRILPSKSFPVPVISVGNLTMGGTGKTPHTEYIAKLLIENNYSPVAILSRGYKRKTKGFIDVMEHHTYTEVGDEPFQFRQKFSKNDVVVCVDASRKRGIKKIISNYPDVKAIILDDAFQHRYVNSGLNILLTDYYLPFFKNHIFPLGSLREPGASAKRADCVVITKSPVVISPLMRKIIISKIPSLSNDNLYFSKIEYQEWKWINKSADFKESEKYSGIFLFTGIVNPYPLIHYLKTKTNNYIPLYKFPDHYIFTKKELLKIIKDFKDHLSINKIIVTTEKDASRLSALSLKEIFSDVPICYVPINIKFHNSDSELFNQKILNYVEKNQRNI